MNTFQVVKDFERAVGEYTNAPYVVSVNSCTMALLLAVAWHLKNDRGRLPVQSVDIPKRTYVGVAQSIIHAGGRPTFRDQDWKGAYQLRPYNIWDSARWFTSGLYAMTEGPNGEQPFGVGAMVCVSFHWSKTLGIQQGGAILHDNAEADSWLRRARFDGRQEGVPPRWQELDQWIRGWHCYMSPEIAAGGLVRLANLPKHNEPIPNDDYADLSRFPIFQ